MAPPDPPLVGAPPDVRVDEDSSAVLAKHGCLHSNSLKDDAEITRYIDDLILNQVLVDPVVRNGLEPLLSWHHDSRWLEEHKDVVGVQELLNAGDIAPLDAGLPSRSPGLQSLHDVATRVSR